MNNNGNSRERIDKEKLSDNDVDQLYDIIEITGNIFDKHGIKYTLEGGSLLGAVRNGGLIPYDNDADFDVLESSLDSIKNLKMEFLNYNLLVIEIPGWGLQISHKDSPDLEPNMWTDGKGRYWTSKWPFLDLISIKYNEHDKLYILAGDVAKNDYPNYYLTKDEWETPFERIKFGHLQLWAIQSEERRANYLDRNYGEWRTKIEMLMDHRKNIYFEQPIVCEFTVNDCWYRKHSKDKN